MNLKEKEALFFQFLPMARKIAGGFSQQQSRYSYEELEDIATYVLILNIYEVNTDERKSKFNEKKGKWSTYLYYRIYWSLKEVTTRGDYQGGIKDWCDREVVKDLQEKEIVNEKHSWLDNLRRELSEEGSALLRILLEAPEELKAGISPKAPARSKSMLHDYLVDVLDWDDYKFQLAWEELEMAIA